jgi:hypothetical protein
MSGKGSFVTEYIGCDKCLKAAKGALLARGKHLCSTELPGRDSTGRALPIIAGKIGGLYAGEELDTHERP